MKLLTTATLNWFNDGCCDVKFLDLWNDASLNYSPGQIIDNSWHTDHYKQLIDNDLSGKLFQKSADRIMRYRFYPKDVMSHFSDFDLYERWVEVGDRIVQRIHLVKMFGRPILDAVTMTEVVEVINEPRRCGFTYATVERHVEQGEWSVLVEWQENGDVRLHAKAISRPVPHEPTRNYSYMRALQKRVHQRGVEHFIQSVL